MDNFLKKAEFFSELSDPDLERLYQISEVVTLSAGEELFAEGSPGDRAYIIKAGELDVVKSVDGREILLQVRANKPGQVIGEMALLEETSRMASVRARTDVILLTIQKEQFDLILDTSPTATRAMLRMILRRWRNNEARLRQSDKMTQLGTFTAGIAHELNNPAAAVKRSTDQLRAVVTHFGQTHAQVSRLELSPDQQDIIQTLADLTQERAVQPLTLTLLARSDLEHEVEVWLEERDVPNGWELAPTLISLDLDVAKLETLSKQFPADQFLTLVIWLHASYSTFCLLTEIAQGTGRISNIVKALKSYAYLDKAAVQIVDIHEGLNDSILILRHKLSQGINLRRDYASDMPQFQACGSELNQVWTNLIDNAIDALAGQGEIIIRTRPDGDYAIVEIEDTGPGIPPETQSKMFDPFFTTKPPGQGTGLGLDISYNIVVHRHRGDIKVFSEPGRTCFQVWLPFHTKSQ